MHTAIMGTRELFHPTCQPQRLTLMHSSLWPVRPYRDLPHWWWARNNGLGVCHIAHLLRASPLTRWLSWLVVTALTLPLALSLAEIASKYPTSAGAYYWCFRLASPKHRVLLSWINGWLGLVGVWTGNLSGLFGQSSKQYP
jgi:hypothetical protein